MSKKPAGQYSSDDIVALEGLDAVRVRPGMYVGGTGSDGMQHCLYEIFDNAVDEALAGHCSRIEVVLYADGSASVADNGRGIPVDKNSKTGMSGLEMAALTLHAGGKFHASAASGGLHGVGLSVANALASRLDATVYRDGKTFLLSCREGKPGVFDGDGPDAKFTLKTGLRDGGKAPAKHVGTTIRFWPDRTIFHPDAVISPDAVINRARTTAFLVPGLAINVRNQTVSPATDETFQFTGGVADMVTFLSTGKSICDAVHLTGEATFTETVPRPDETGHMRPTEVERTVQVNVALKWDAGYDTNVLSFVNVVTTPNGGTHVKGFERGLLAAIRKGYDGTRIMRQHEDPVLAEDVAEGLTAVISVQFPEPSFEGQTKGALGTPAITKIVQDTVSTGIRAWIDGKKKAQARTVLEKIAQAARNRVAARTQREAARRKTSLETASMPAKLVDCRTTGVHRSELFLVEGDSALGSCRLARSSEYQALLPLRGKILNVQKASLSQILGNAEAAAIIQVIGAGSGKSFDLDAMRYGKVFLFSDADVDGSHIRSLLIVLFAKLMRPVIESGRLYAAVPPLFKIETTGRNKERIYAYSATEMEQLVAGLEKAGKTIKRPISRYKGLGEMNPDELWETTMDPAVRTVRQITLGDVEEAEKALELLFGNAVDPRREWLISNADRLDRDAIDA